MVKDNLIISDLGVLDNLLKVETLEDHYKAFIISSRIEGRADKTLLAYRDAIPPLIRYCVSIGVTLPEQITVNVIRSYMAECTQHLQAVSINDYFRIIRRWLNWLVDEEVIRSNPVLKIKPPRPENKIIETFRAEHIQRMFKVCEDQGKYLAARNQAMILVFLDTGMRLSENTRLKIGDVDLATELIRVHGKGSKQRMVRIGKKAQRALTVYLKRRRHAAEEVWLTEERKPLTVSGVKTILYKIGKYAEINDVRCSAHTFRHTFAISYLRNGGDVFTLQHLLGHSTLVMTQRYLSSLQTEDAVKKHRLYSPVDNMDI